MNRIIAVLFVSSLLVSTSAMADVAIDPCEGKDAGAECTLLAGGTGTCVSNAGTLNCEAAATNNSTNNSTNNATNNATNNSTNNGTTTDTNNGTTNAPVDDGTTTAPAKTDDGGCSSTGDKGGLISILFAFGLIMLGRKRS